MPAPSCPSATGVRIGQSPREGWRSLWQTPALMTSTSTSPGPGGSSSASSTTSGRPRSQRMAAVIFIALGLSRESLVCQRHRPPRQRGDAIAKRRETRIVRLSTLVSIVDLLNDHSDLEKRERFVERNRREI